MTTASLKLPLKAQALSQVVTAAFRLAQNLGLQSTVFCLELAQLVSNQLWVSVAIGKLGTNEKISLHAKLVDVGTVLLDPVKTFIIRLLVLETRPSLWN